MRPFALGHRLMLEQIENGFTSGIFPAFADLVSGAFICAHTWEENLKLNASTWRRWLRLKVWGVFAGKFDVPTAMLAFHGYVRDGDVFPETRDTPGEMRQLSAPRLARLYLFLRAHGFSESEAMNLPMNAANILYAAKAEQEGKIDLISDTFREMVRASQGRAA